MPEHVQNDLQVDNSAPFTGRAVPQVLQADRRHRIGRMCRRPSRAANLHAAASPGISTLSGSLRLIMTVTCRDGTRRCTSSATPLIAVPRIAADERSQHRPRKAHKLLRFGRDASGQGGQGHGGDRAGLPPV